jgi:hypothetical protein
MNKVETRIRMKTGRTSRGKVGTVQGNKARKYERETGGQAERKK